VRILAIALCLVAADASAQTVELGGRFGVGCGGTEDSLCSGASPLVGVNASLWAGDSVELGAQFARLNREDLAFRAGVVPVDITVTDRKRDFVSLLFVYHFLKGRPLRPMLGLGSGWYSDASRTSCQPEGCRVILRSGPLLGQYRTWDLDAIFVVGLSGDVGDRWVWRGGWQSHRFGNDENSAQQFFVGAGYRFGVD
jgi:hypothetical protein